MRGVPPFVGQLLVALPFALVLGLVMGVLLPISVYMMVGGSTALGLGILALMAVKAGEGRQSSRRGGRRYR